MPARMLAVALGLLLVPAFLHAGPPDKAAADPKLDRLLRAWEAKSGTIRDLQCEFKLTTTDAVINSATVEYGKASGMRPYFGRLDLMDEKGNFTRIFISTGRAVHQYEFKTKQEIVHVLPEMQQDNTNTLPGPLGFVFGMTANQAKSRFNLTLAKEYTKNERTPRGQETVEYADVQITPRTQADRQEFKSAILVFNKSTSAPREIILTEPNGNEQHWILTRLEANVTPPLSAGMFAPFDRNKIGPLKDWKRIVNNLGDQPAPPDPAKTKSTPPSKSRPNATRPQQKR